MTQRRFSSLILMVGLALLGWAAQSAFADDVRPQVGHLAPDFTFKDLDGNEVSLSDFRGQAVFFSPWFSGCPICQGEMVEWQAFHEAFGDLVTVFGINVADSPDVAADFIRQRGVTFPTLLDPKGDFLIQYKITKMPTMFFVDPQGIIREISKVTLTADGIAQTFAEKVFGTPILPLTGFEVVRQASRGDAAGELIDTDGDGRPDGARVDLDGDRVFEATVAIFKGRVRGTIPNGDVLDVTMRFEAPAAEFIRVDLDGDGVPEITIEDEGFDGVDRVAVDLDSDGTAELSFPTQSE